MALNKIVYFPNPSLGEILGTTLTATGSPATLLTVGAGTATYIKDFTVTMAGTAAASNDLMVCKLKIGTGEFTFALDLATNGANYSEVFSGKDLGFNGGFLQTGDTIIFTYVNAGSATNDFVSASVTVEDYTA